MSDLDELDGAEGQGSAELDAPGTHHESTGRRARTRADITPEERAYNRSVYAVTHHERYGKPGSACVNYCLEPGQRRRGVRCAGCYGPVEVRAFTEAEQEIEPGFTRAERFAAWVGGWVGAFFDAMLFPFRVGADHTRALVRDTIQEAIAAAFAVLLDDIADQEGPDKNADTVGSSGPVPSAAGRGAANPL